MEPDTSNRAPPRRNFFSSLPHRRGWELVTLPVLFIARLAKFHEGGGRGGVPPSGRQRIRGRSFFMRAGTKRREESRDPASIRRHPPAGRIPIKCLEIFAASAFLQPPLACRVRRSGRRWRQRPAIFHTSIAISGSKRHRMEKKEPLTFNARSVSIFYFFFFLFFSRSCQISSRLAQERHFSEHARAEKAVLFFIHHDTVAYIHHNRVHFYHIYTEQPQSNKSLCAMSCF